MTTTKMLTLSAAAAFLMIGSGAVWAQCDLNENQLQNGWQCVEGSTAGPTITTYEQQGASNQCKVFQQETTITTFTAINPGGNVVADKGDVSEPVPTGDPMRDTSQGGTVTCPF